MTTPAPRVVLYERPDCWKCVEVEEVLARLGVAHEIVNTRTTPGAGDLIEQISGERRVPLLIDGDRAVWDRRRIIRHLEETYGDPGDGPTAADLPSFMGGMCRLGGPDAAGTDSAAP